MRILLTVFLIGGCALLTGARIPVFASDKALWMAALPSTAPRVSVNVAAALLNAGTWESAGDYALHAVELSQRPESTYERAAVLALVKLQIQYLDTWHPVCDRPAYQPYCF